LRVCLGDINGKECTNNNSNVKFARERNTARLQTSFMVGNATPIHLD
jgi:hypothetical protein